MEGRSLWQDARRRYAHNRAAVTCLIMLVLIALFVTFARWYRRSYFVRLGMMSNAPDGPATFSEPTPGATCMVRR